MYCQNTINICISYISEKKTPNASWIYNQKSSKYALKCLWPVIWFRCLCILLTGKDAFQNAKYVTGDARIPRKSLNSNWNQILPLTLSDINLPVSAGRDVTAIFNISFSRNKNCRGYIFFSKSLDGCTQEAVSVYSSANIQIMLQCAAWYCRTIKARSLITRTKML